MRGTALFLTALTMAAFPPAASAQQRSAAVFDFELVDTSGGDPLRAQDAEHQARVAQASERLRARLAESGRFKVVDIAPVTNEAHASNLQACGGCDVTLADRVGADLSVTGSVHKVSNLILNMIIFVRDAKTGGNVAVAQADMRGDTDESWLRTVDWLARNRLLAAETGASR
jgi:acyl-coenzyme A thioesterase PaaI-like protein